MTQRVHRAGGGTDTDTANRVSGAQPATPLRRPPRMAQGTGVDHQPLHVAPETDRSARRSRVTCISGGGAISAITIHPRLDDEAPVAADRRSADHGSLADRTALWQVMEPDVVCVEPELEIALVLPLLTALEVRALTVVDHRGQPIGMVSRSDLHGHTDAETVADVMMCVAFTLPETASLSRAAAVMAYEDVHRVPVVSPGGQVVGVISAIDVARWLARHDGYVVPGPSEESVWHDDVPGRVAAALRAVRAHRHA